MIFLSEIILFDEYLIVDHLGEIEKFIDFRPIFISKKPGWRIGRIASEKVRGWASPRGLAHGLSNITHSRNAYGSEKIVFHFTMFAQSDTELPEKMICNFPITQHRWQDCMIISHTTGKKHKLFIKK
jgi:hypothetical protein